MVHVVTGNFSYKGKSVNINLSLRFSFAYIEWSILIGLFFSTSIKTL